jgi:iron complex transport system ATP-binding protein
MKFTPTISCQNLTIGYASKKNAKTICKDISMQLETSKLYALIGQNGIGKSTFLKTLTGILKPLNGSISILEKNILTWDETEFAKNVSVVLTEKIPLSNLTVYELVALGRQPYTNWLGRLSKEDFKKIEDALVLTELKTLENKKIVEISDGQMQRVLIARALTQDTPIIILDEPTTHLDLYHKVTLIKLLKRLANTKNKCILFSTHDVDLAIQLADEMLLMYDEKIELDSPCNFIEKGVFDLIYKEDFIQFDAKKGKFVIT